jgi:hypothetical protein
MRGRTPSAASGAYTGDWGGAFPPLLLRWSLILNIYLRLGFNAINPSRLGGQRLPFYPH